MFVTDGNGLDEDQTETMHDMVEQKQRKVEHRELQEKQLSPEKRNELNAAKSKEWGKIIDSGSMVVHAGQEAKRMEGEVGKDRILKSRCVYTDDGTPE